MMKVIADCRRELRDLDEEIATRKSELRQLVERRQKRAYRMEMLLDEATGEGPPTLFSAIPLEVHEVARPALRETAQVVPVSPVPAPIAPESETDWVAKYNLTGWRATPLNKLRVDAEIAESIGDMLRPELCFAGSILSELIQGAKFGLDAEQLSQLRKAIYSLGGWRELGLDYLHLKPKVESKIARAGVETLGQLADRLDQGDTFHLAENDLRDVRKLIEDARADDDVDQGGVGENEKPEEATEPQVCSPVGSFKLRDIKDFPSSVADYLDGCGVRTLHDMEQRVGTVAKKHPNHSPKLESLVGEIIRNLDHSHTLTNADIWAASDAIIDHLNTDTPTPRSEKDEPVNNPGRGEPIRELGLALSDLEKVKTIAGMSTDPKKVKGPQKVDVIHLKAKPYVIVGTLYAPNYTQWELAPLFDETEFRGRHPDLTLSDMPRESQGPEFYTGTRVLVGRGKTSKVMVIGARGERRLLVHNK